jgi:hypothetical protein
MTPRIFTRRAALAGISAAPALCLTPAWAQDLAGIFNQRDNSSAMTVDHALWAGVLSAYVKPSPDGVNRFAYGKVSKSARKDLNAYVDAMAKVAVSKLAEREQRAFWANLYNALTIQVILDHYPVKSIRDISISPGLFAIGPWGKKLTEVEGRALSLDDIEHRILRKVWKDPRVHYSVNCASIGCPNLPVEPFTGANLEKMLDEGARNFVNHPRGVSVAANGRVTASSIYDWFSEDFGSSDANVLAHLRKYAAKPLLDKLAAAKSISSYAYDWSLNDAL